MWYEVVNGSPDKPADVDSTSSRVYVYVRRNFELVPAAEDMPAYWRWQEMKIPREMWEVVKLTLGHDNALDDVYSALVEIVDLMMGGE